MCVYFGWTAKAKPRGLLLLSHIFDYCCYGLWEKRQCGALSCFRSPIITSRYHSSYLTSGCWSPSRAGVFYVTRSDGFLDVWDIGHDQKSVSLSHKVSDVSLSSVGVQGNYVAVGDVSGTVSLLSVCDALAQPGPAEKALVSNILERETKKEKLLEVREREMRRNRVRKEDQKNRAGQEDIKDINDNDEIKKLENEFIACL
ncbi:hypothetical protein THAOC_18665 [Thalassiosira oceanica]|uniref:Dynein intermediate chain n=1 Tax=Thalassiosira oceanica TaxID=159749 RepID=K0S468_THAOC|nr:hypothetical protein THAOC_18665 [Thalassiosira oceanica]|eukprot:EJK60918.1 hypothetical protein THAOC_18665 [Thalassiosira oceanica]